MTWLFPEPNLDPGEVIEFKTKAQLMPVEGCQTTGVLFLTNHRLVFVPGRGTPKDRAAITQFARSRCTSVTKHDDLVSVGRGSAWWRPVSFSLADGHSVRFGVRNADKVAAFLRSQLGVGEY